MCTGSQFDDRQGYKLTVWKNPFKEANIVCVKKSLEQCFQMWYREKEIRCL